MIRAAMVTNVEPLMHRLPSVLPVIASIALPFVVASTAVGAPVDDAVERRFREMAERIDALERDNAGLRDEVTKLREESGDGWITDQRAAEIRALVSDVLADADARSNLQSSGMTAGWSDGFFLSSPDGRFRMELDGQMQFRYIGNRRDRASQFDTTDRYRGGFENTRTRLTLRGHVFTPDLTYLVRGGFSRGGGGGARDTLNEVPGGTFKLFDAWVRWQLDDRWDIRFGQFKLPFMRESLVSSSRQLLVERSMIATNLNVGRSQGVELTYTGDWLRWMVAISDGGSDNLLSNGILANTQGPNSPWNVEGAEYSLTSRIEWLYAGAWRQFNEMTSRPDDPFGLLGGVAVHIQQREYGQPGNDNSWFSVTGDLSMAFGGANFHASATYTYVDNQQFGFFDLFGAVVQGGYYIAPKTEIFARGEFGYIDARGGIIDPDNLWVVTFGVNHYFDGHDVTFTADMGIGIDEISQFWSSDLTGWRPDGNNTAPQFVIRTQFQLLF